MSQQVLLWQQVFVQQCALIIAAQIHIEPLQVLEDCRVQVAMHAVRVVQHLVL